MGAEERAKDSSVPHAQSDPTYPQDRRHELRQTVDTGAILYLVDLGAKLQGRIVDLSLSGCRIHTDQRFPLGIFRRVETEFHLEGLPFRLAGVTQAIYDQRGVGIRFLNISARKHEQLVQLIAEIEDALATHRTQHPHNASE